MGTPNYPRTVVDTIQALRRQAAAAYTSSNTRQALTEIRDNILELYGQVIVKPGGKLIAQYANGETALHVGANTLSDGTPAHGVLIRRPGGETVLWTFGPDGGGSAYWALYDKSGNIIISDDADSGQGLATPYIPWTVTPWGQVMTPPQSTTAGSWSTLYRAHGPKQHPRVKVLLICQSDADTTGQVRVVNAATNAVIAGPVTIAVGSNNYQTLEGSIGGEHLGDVYIDVQAQRTGGAGAIRIGVSYLEGKQS